MRTRRLTHSVDVRAAWNNGVLILVPAGPAAATADLHQVEGSVYNVLG